MALRRASALLPAAAAPIALCSTRPTPSEREALRDRADREAKLQRYVQTEALQLYARHCKGAERSQRCAETRRTIEETAHALAHPGTTWTILIVSVISIDISVGESIMTILLTNRTFHSKWTRVILLDPNPRPRIIVFKVG